MANNNNKIFEYDENSLTEYEKYLLDKYDVEMIFPSGIEYVAQKKQRY
ncbi:hypothetical protein [Clostridium butyricum]